MRNQIVITALLLVALTAGTSAAPILDPAHIHQQTLDNGLRVVVKSERQWPVVALGVVIRTGSGYETKDNSGVAHLIEHLLFETGQAEEGLGPWVENMGGYINGSTSRDFTQVTLAASSRYLDQIVPKLAHSIFEAEFTPKTVAHQRRIVLREMADRLSSATELINLFTWKLAYTQHPYGHPIPGSPDRIDEIDVQEVRAFYQKFYQPNNAALIVVGDVDPKEFFRLAQQSFGRYESSDATIEPPPAEPPQTQIRTRIERLGRSNTLLQFAWHAPGIARQREVCAMDLIYMLLDEELAQMAQAPSDDKMLLEGAVVDYLTQRWPGLLIISAVTEPAYELDLREAIVAKIKQLGTKTISPERLAVLKQRIYAQYAFSNEAYTDQVNSLAFYEAIETYHFAVNYIDLIDEITAKELQQTASKYLKLDSYSLVVIRPKPAAGSQQEAWQR